MHDKVKKINGKRHFFNGIIASAAVEREFYRKRKVRKTDKLKNLLNVIPPVN